MGRFYDDDLDDQEAPRTSLTGVTAADRRQGGSQDQLFGIMPRADSRVQAQPDARSSTPDYGPSGSGYAQQPVRSMQEDAADQAASAAGPDSSGLMNPWGVGAATTPKSTQVTGNAQFPLKSAGTDLNDAAAGASPTNAAGGPTAAAGTAAAGGAGGVMPWLAPIATAIADRQQEQAQRQQAKAGLQGEYASQFGFPTYGLEGKQRGRAITERHGGLGLGMLGKLFRRRG